MINESFILRCLSVLYSLSPPAKVNFSFCSVYSDDIPARLHETRTAASLSTEALSSRLPRELAAFSRAAAVREFAVSPRRLASSQPRLAAPSL